MSCIKSDKCLFRGYEMEKAMAPTPVLLPGESHGWRSLEVLAWRIPGMGEPGGPPSMGLHRVGHD